MYIPMYVSEDSAWKESRAVQAARIFSSLKEKKKSK